MSTFGIVSVKRNRDIRGRVYDRFMKPNGRNVRGADPERIGNVVGSGNKQISASVYGGGIHSCMKASKVHGEV